MSGMMSLLHILLRLMHEYLVCGICISMPHLSSLLAFLCLLRWRYASIDIDVLGFVWGFGQSFFSIRPMFPITVMNVVFVFATSQLEINQQVSNHVSRCTTKGVLPAPWLEPLHTPFVKASFQMETIECDIQMMGRGYSVLFYFIFFGVLQFSMQTHYYDNAHIYSGISLLWFISYVRYIVKKLSILLLVTKALFYILSCVLYSSSTN